MSIIFQKQYDGESLYDLSRDIAEAFEVNYNPAIAKIPQDEYGIQKGIFNVKIEWTEHE